MELLDYDEDELRILQELENDLIQSPEPIQPTQKPKRKRRTKAQMIEFRVSHQFIKRLLSTCF